MRHFNIGQDQIKEMPFFDVITQAFTAAVQRDSSCFLIGF